MKPAPFQYAAPDQLDEAVALLDEYREDGKVIAGGQSLMPLLALRMARFDMLVDVNHVRQLQGIQVDEGELVIGAATRHATVGRDALIRRHAPLLADVTPYIGHFQIRNRGTIGGAIAHADPAAEYPAAALALDAEVEVADWRSRRRIPIDEFLDSAYVTTIEPGELLLSLRIPITAGRSGFAVAEITRRHGDFALVGGVAGVWLGDDDAVSQARVVLFGVGPRPVRMGALEAELIGRKQPPLDLEASCRRIVADLSPPGDVQATAAYRREVAVPVLRRLVTEALARAGAERREAHDVEPEADR